MIVIDGEAACAVDKCRLRTRFPKLVSGRSVVRHCRVVQFVFAATRALAGYEYPGSILTYRKIKWSIRATSTDPAINVHPLLRSITRIVSDRHIIELTRRPARNSANVDEPVVRAKRDDIAIIDAGWHSIPSL